MTNLPATYFDKRRSVASNGRRERAGRRASFWMSMSASELRCMMAQVVIDKSLNEVVAVVIARLAA